MIVLKVFGIILLGIWGLCSGIKVLLLSVSLAISVSSNAPWLHDADMVSKFAAKFGVSLLVVIAACWGIVKIVRSMRNKTMYQL